MKLPATWNFFDLEKPVNSYTDSGIGMPFFQTYFRVWVYTADHHGPSKLEYLHLRISVRVNRNFFPRDSTISSCSAV